MFEGVESEQNHRAMEKVVETLGCVAEQFEQTEEPDRQGSNPGCATHQLHLLQ